MSVIVRDLTAEDEARWRVLWDGYLEFYKTDLSEDVTAATWARLIDPDSSMFGLVAELDGTVQGIVNCVLHDNTWTTEPVCYLEDLFIAPDTRGQGAGRALIEAVATRAKVNSWHRVYWRTHNNNVAAQLLYGKVAKRTDWITFELSDL